MQIKSAEFITSAKSLADCPAWEYPEFAFIGRSNVGKSSLINLLANRHSLAKVSATPGKTRLLNFFLMNKTWSLVDLPGYGFAKAAKNDKFDFNERAGDYLEGRPNLRRVFTLIDSRHTPQRIDIDFLEWLGSTGTPFTLIFTKSDKQSPAKTKAAIELFLQTVAPLLPMVPDVLASSAKSRDGRSDILREISKHIGK